MDRTAFSYCAGILLASGAVLSTGCDAQHTNPRSTAAESQAPAVLALPAAPETQWKRLEAVVVPASAMQQPFSMLPEPEAQSPPSPNALEIVPSDAVSELTILPGVVTTEEDAPLAAPQADGMPSADAGDRRPVETSVESSEVPHTDLPWAHAAPRGPAMAAVAAEADKHVQHGFKLAQRGAMFSARAEFVAAIQLIAQASDSQHNTRLYTKSLTAGLVALRESRDFARRSAGIPEADVLKTIATHKTPILKSVDCRALTPLVAAQRYYTYAQEQLSVATAQEPSGSLALYGLGKAALRPVGADQQQSVEQTALAMVFYQAALMAGPGNFRAANELGVLLAEHGNLPLARELLQRSVSISPQPATWQNLAVVHSRLGESQRADYARQQAMALEAASPSGTPAVQWVDPTTFTMMTPSDGLIPPAGPATMPSKQTKAAPAPEQPAASVAKKGISDWLPWNIRR